MKNDARNVTFKRSHFHWGLMIAVLMLGAAGVGAFYAGGGNLVVENGKTIITAPDLATLRGRVQIITPNGEKKTIIVQDDAVANGQVATTADGFGPDGKLQRTDAQWDRYDPIAKLGAQLKESTLMLSDTINSTNHSVAAVSGQVQALATDISSVKTDVASLGNRVATLEKQPIAVAPVPVPAAPTAAPAAKEVPVTEAAPAPATNQQADAQDSLTGFKMPKGLHIVGMGDDDNIAKAHGCLAPHHLELDKSSGKSAGYNDPKTGKPVMRYRNVCV